MTTSSRDAGEASCTASCRSCSERAMSHTCDMRRTRKTAESGHRRTPQRQHGQREAETPAHQRPESHRRARAWGPGQRPRVRIQSFWKGRKWPTCPNLPGAAFPDFRGGAGVEFLVDHFSGDKVAFARNGFAERAKNGQRVSVTSPTGPADDRGVGNVLAERSRDVWAVIGKFGLTPRLCAVRAGPLSVRRADRDAESGARVAWGGGRRV